MKYYFDKGMCRGLVNRGFLYHAISQYKNKPRVLVEGFCYGPGKRRAALGSLITVTAFRR